MKTFDTSPEMRLSHPLQTLAMRVSFKRWKVNDKLLPTSWRSTLPATRHWFFLTFFLVGRTQTVLLLQMQLVSKVRLNALRYMHCWRTLKNS